MAPLDNERVPGLKDVRADENIPLRSSRSQLTPPSSDLAYSWSPGKHLAPPFSTAPGFSLIILNTPLKHPSIAALISRSCFTICADGGANRLHNAHISTSDSNDHPWHPNVILGDLDSLHPNVRAYYQSKHVPIVQEACQNSTDLDKCLRHIADNNHSSNDVIVVGSLGGRVDHGFATLQSLVKAEQLGVPSLKPELVLLTPQNVSFVLKPGHNRIHTPLKEGKLGKSVGIIPLGQRAVITTTGLEWDVTNWETGFGGNVSTSNHVVADSVTVHVRPLEGSGETSTGVLFTIELAEELKAADGW